MRGMSWRPVVTRWVLGAAVAGVASATLVVLPSGVASALPDSEPCDGAACVPITGRGSAGEECAAHRLFPFGLDGGGNGLICLAVFGAPSTRTWKPVNLVGVRDFATVCNPDENGAAAQSPDGLPMRCTDGLWSRYVVGIGSA